jgi:hypothetical protein
LHFHSQIKSFIDVLVIDQYQCGNVRIWTPPRFASIPYYDG